MAFIPDEFLLPEIREGFYIPAAVKQAWAAQMEVLLEIDRVCKKHHIRYFADWGTLLGTVRHGGYIPWDDDLDIVMKREDYRRFMDVARLDMEEGFHVQTYENQPDFWLFIGKVVGKNRMCFEKEHLQRFHNFPFIACVDIFVLDYVHRDPRKEEQRRRTCKYMLGVADAIVEGRISGKEIERDLATIEEMSGHKMKKLSDPVAMGRFLYGQVEQIFAEVPEAEADILTQLFPWGLMGERHHYPKEYYAESIELPFECITMPVPVAYDCMLRKRYGDYLRVVKAVAGHDYPFFEGQRKNLQKVVDFDLPAFRCDTAMLTRTACHMENRWGEDSFKGLTSVCTQELKTVTDKVTACLSEDPGMVPGPLQENLQAAQQLAIDLGNMIEMLKGEGHESVAALEQYCEVIFEIFEGYGSLCATEGDCSARIDARQVFLRSLEEVLGKCVAVVKNSILERENIVFLPVSMQEWEDMKPVWKEKMEAGWDCYVIPLPFYYKDYDGSPREIVEDWWVDQPDIIPVAYQDFPFEKLQLLHPEAIVYANPFDNWNEAISVPGDFYSTNLKAATEQMIYVSPGEIEDFTQEQPCEYHNMKYYVLMPGVMYADQILVYSEIMKETYTKKLTECAGAETRSVWAQKIRVMDRKEKPHEHMSSVQDAKKVILYCISLGCLLEKGEAAFGKLSANLKIFTENPSVRVKMTVYPDMECLGHMESETAREIFGRLKELASQTGAAGAVEFIDLSSILQKGDFPAYAGGLTDTCHAYYGDGSPFVTWFGAQKKPVMIQNYEVV